jgi:hypothetical protein
VSIKKVVTPHTFESNSRVGFLILWADSFRFEKLMIGGNIDKFPPKKPKPREKNTLSGNSRAKQGIGIPIISELGEVDWNWRFC